MWQTLSDVESQEEGAWLIDDGDLGLPGWRWEAFDQPSFVLCGTASGLSLQCLLQLDCCGSAKSINPKNIYEGSTGGVLKT